MTAKSLHRGSKILHDDTLPTNPPSCGPEEATVPFMSMGICQDLMKYDNLLSLWKHTFRTLCHDPQTLLTY